ncbi:MAG: glycosyltransferase, partial [Verrucomicrobia bacterium]|nr:glycosyltransferase [Verrucomicrobiota bacterium]MBR6464285.1 glycosyltransferase [Verrucomicrobiota bacterium]
MKVIFSHNLPFFLAHGGMQTLSESLMREIAGLGVEVEQERWWDPQQKGDILHYIMRPPYAVNVRLAHEKGFKVIMTENLDQTASRTRTQLFIQRQITRWARRLVPGLVNRMAWDVYQLLDAMVYVVPIELKVAQYLFDAPADRGYVISQGLEEQAIQKLSSPEGMGQGDFLVSVAVISERKNSLLLAEAARKANVPIVFLGKPLVEDDYYQRFLKAADGKLVKYAGFVSVEEKYDYLRRARGFALMSQFESGCIAIYEAAAAGLPLLLPDLPWASKVYGHLEKVRTVSLGSADHIAEALKSFYSWSQRQSQQTFPIPSWKQVAQKYVKIYEKILSEKS